MLGSMLGPEHSGLEAPQPCLAGRCPRQRGVRGRCVRQGCVTRRARARRSHVGGASRLATRARQDGHRCRGDRAHAQCRHDQEPPPWRAEKDEPTLVWASMPCLHPGTLSGLAPHPSATPRASSQPRALKGSMVRSAERLKSRGARDGLSKPVRAGKRARLSLLTAGRASLGRGGGCAASVSLPVLFFFADRERCAELATRAGICSG